MRRNQIPLSFSIFQAYRLARFWPPRFFFLVSEDLKFPQNTDNRKLLMRCFRYHDFLYNKMRKVYKNAEVEDLIMGVLYGVINDVLEGGWSLRLACSGFGPREQNVYPYRSQHPVYRLAAVVYRLVCSAAFHYFHGVQVVWHEVVRATQQQQQ